MNGKDSEASESVTQTSNLDIEIDEMGDITVGSPFAYRLFVKNNRSDACTAKVNLKVLYKTYFDTVTGIATEKDCDEIRLQPGASEKFMIEVTEDEANKRPQDEFNFELKATAICKEDARDNATKDLGFRMRKPDIQISGPATCSLSDTIQAELSFKNPLTVPLSGCSVSFAGGFDLVGIASDTLYFSNIAAGETWSRTFDLLPKEAPRGQAERALCVGFDSIQLTGIAGKYSTKLV
ncbi:protein-glutamine gamma-glutamyltransferase K-like [Haliotis rufescens]|uniref:protein-glutamine gamma-glutamyltransferase K-like n=1 Tax=Haliotis rufescens TaxID=6454 RepID=UPI00201F9C55|nr:protein-glutamine gamma-glutamyltransferase K-like [Haliotis rufescens]